MGFLDDIVVEVNRYDRKRKQLRENAQKDGTMNRILSMTERKSVPLLIYTCHQVSFFTTDGERKERPGPRDLPSRSVETLLTPVSRDASHAVGREAPHFLERHSSEESVVVMKRASRHLFRILIMRPDEQENTFVCDVCVFSKLPAPGGV